MERVAVLLLLGSLAVLAAADPAEYQSKGKYGYEYKGPHGKEYPPHGYPPEGPKYKYDHAPHGYEYKPDGYYKPEVPYSYDPSHYDNKVYENPLNGDYGQPSPYDGGYWGGLNGRQIIHLQTLFPENAANSSLINPQRRDASTKPACKENPIPPQTLADICDADFGILCAWRHPDNDYYSKGSDYASAKYSPIFKTPPTIPLEIGKGWAELTYEDELPLDGIKLVTFNDHQKGYKVADITGFINFKTGADACHPLLGPDTKVTFNEVKVPVYLIFGKIELPNDPAILLPLGGFPYIKERNTAKVQSADSKEKDSDYKSDKADYKTTPEGNKYTLKGDTAYVWNEKDQSLCGLTLVARGDVKVQYNPTGTANGINYEGILEWPIAWSDLITTLPLLINDDVEEPVRRSFVDINFDDINFTFIQFIFNFNGGDVNLEIGSVFAVLLERALDRIAAVCKTHPDTPWITPGAITLDVHPVP